MDKFPICPVSGLLRGDGQVPVGAFRWKLDWWSLESEIRQGYCMCWLFVLFCLLSYHQSQRFKLLGSKMSLPLLGSPSYNRIESGPSTCSMKINKNED